jgi:hypothetical protein
MDKPALLPTWLYICKDTILVQYFVCSHILYFTAPVDTPTFYFTLMKAHITQNEHVLVKESK